MYQNTSTYTPGPWEMKRIPREQCPLFHLAHVSEGRRLGIGSITMPIGDEEAEANARLIEAAPRLLSMLKKLHQINEADMMSEVADRDGLGMPPERPSVTEWINTLIEVKSLIESIEPCTTSSTQ